MRRNPVRLRVLIVDDDASLTRLFETVIKEQGFGTPTVVYNAREALEKVEGHDLVLLDQRLPDGHGLDLIPALRQVPGEPAVVLVTGHGDETLAAAALRAGADDYLTKDSSMSDVLPQVLERVRRHRALRRALADAEREMVVSARQAAIGQLTVTLHHSLNNPLQAASAELEILLAHPGQLAPAQKESLETIRDALRRIREVLNRVGTLGHEETIEYLDGMAMIDLARRTRPAPMIRGHAAILVPEEDTARVLALLLRQAGFTTHRASDATELEQLASRPDLGLVLVSGSSAPGADPLGGFRPGTSRSYGLVALVSGSGTEARQAGADHVVSLPFDPATLMDEIATVIPT